MIATVKAKCAYCKSVLNDGSVFCIECSKFQNTAYNTLTNIAGISAAATLLASFLTYLVGNLPPLIQSILKEQINVTSFEYTERSHADVNIFNAGSADIFIDELMFFNPNRAEPRSSFTLTIGKVVKSKEYLTFDRRFEPNVQYHFPNAEGLPEGWSIPSDQLGILLDMGDCFAVQYTEGTGRSISTVLEFMENHGNGLLRVSEEVWLRYHSGDKNEWREIKLDSLGVLLKKNDEPKCDGQLGFIPATGTITE